MGNFLSMDMGLAARAYIAERKLAQIARQEELWSSPEAKALLRAASQEKYRRLREGQSWEEIAATPFRMSEEDLLRFSEAMGYPAELRIHGMPIEIVKAPIR